MVGKRLGLSQLLQPEDLGSCLGISVLPRVMLPPLTHHWCKAQLSMPQFPCQEELCPLLPTVRVPGASPQYPPGPYAWRREGDGSGAVCKLAPWASLLPELGYPAWAATSQGSLCICVGDKECAGV